VENSRQADFLRRLHCDKLRGDLFSRSRPTVESEPLRRQAPI